MNSKRIALLCVLAGTIVLLLFSSLIVHEKPKVNPPNIVLILMDDLGYGDLGCYGALQYQTPNIDKLAANGVRFTNFLVAQPVCSASRAGLLTGCYPNRIGIAGALYPNSKLGLNPAETTIADLLKATGYATAMFGKWHLGDKPEFSPYKQGFNEYVGLPYSNDMWPVDYDGLPIPKNIEHRKKNYPALPLLSNSDTLEYIRTLDDQSKLTGIYTEKAINFIKRHKNSPFFIYLPHSMPHVPISASARFKGKSKQGTFGDVMMEIDWSVGEIMKTLRESGLENNTIVIFTSDNGPWINYGNHAGSTGGLREGKGNTFEGGQRVPCLIQWKGIAPAGTICNKLTSTIDFLPTIAKICDAKLPDHKIDGVDILPLIKGNLERHPRKVFYYYYGKNNLEAVRQEDWKLVLPHQGRSYYGQLPKNDGFPGTVSESTLFPLALYDLRRDPAENYDVKELYPEIVSQLQKIAEEARADLGDDLTQRKGKNIRPSNVLK